MSQCNLPLLHAYLDGEVDPATRQQVERRLTDCPACAREIVSLRELSHLLIEPTSDDITPAELARIHHVIEDDADRPILRLGGVLGTIAASILIVSAAWMMEVPGKHPTSPSPQSMAAAPSWEKIALTLRVEHPSQNDEPIQLADAMLEGLYPTQP